MLSSTFLFFIIKQTIKVVVQVLSILFTTESINFNNFTGSRHVVSGN